jgi:hypothetical protein
MNCTGVLAWLNLLYNAAATAGGLATPTVGLYTNAITPTVNTTIGELTEPTYDGYARQTPALLAKRYTPNQDIELALGLATFQPTDAGSLPMDVLGSFLMGGTTEAPVLMAVCNFSAPYSFLSQYSALDVSWELQLPNQQVYGGIANLRSSGR